jgi:cyclopropane fatty-acyl-phospholipid synthase-like methyltransferase
MQLIDKISPLYMNQEKTYDEAYFLANHLRKLRSWRGYFVRRYYRYVASYAMAGAAKLHPHAKVLDIGCGVGILVQQFIKLGYQAKGVDVSQAAIANSIIPQHCSLVATTAKLDYPDQYFDLVVSREVLEHIPAEDIDACIDERDRVSKGKMVHIIAVRERGTSAINDPTHVNVQAEQRWITTFAKHQYKAIRQPRKCFFSPFGNKGYLMFTKDR